MIRKNFEKHQRISQRWNIEVNYDQNGFISMFYEEHAIFN